MDALSFRNQWYIMVPCKASIWFCLCLWTGQILIKKNPNHTNKKPQTKQNPNVISIKSTDKSDSIPKIISFKQIKLRLI